MLSRSVMFNSLWHHRAHQTPPSMGLSRQEYWSGLPFPNPGCLPDPGIEPVSLVSWALTGGFFTTEPPGKPYIGCCSCSASKLCGSLQPHGLQHTRFPVLHYLSEFAYSCPLNWWCPPTISSSVTAILLLLSIYPSISFFSSESVLCIRWPKYWSFSFSISPFNEYSGLISFRIDWFDLAVQGTLKSLLRVYTKWKGSRSVLICLPSLQFRLLFGVVKRLDYLHPGQVIVFFVLQFINIVTVQWKIYSSSIYVLGKLQASRDLTINNPRTEWSLFFELLSDEFLPLVLSLLSAPKVL